MCSSQLDKTRETTISLVAAVVGRYQIMVYQPDATFWVDTKQYVLEEKSLCGSVYTHAHTKAPRGRKMMTKAAIRPPVSLLERTVCTVKWSTAILSD